MSVIFSLFPGLSVTTALTLRLVIISFRPAAQSIVHNFPPYITLWHTSSTGGLLRLQHDA